MFGATSRLTGAVTPHEAGKGLGRDRAAERDDREGGDRGDENRNRGHDEQRPIDPAGRKLLLEEEFHAVGDRLPQAEHADLRQRNPHAVRPKPILHPGGDPALDQHQIRRGSHQTGHQHGDLQQWFEHNGASWSAKHYCMIRRFGQ